jgi:hypothetical protein
LGKGYLTRRQGVPKGVVAYAVLAELGSLLLTGVALAAFLVPPHISLPLLGRPSEGARYVLGVAATLLVAVLPLLMGWAGRRAGRARLRWAAPVARLRPLWGALAVTTASWVLFGIAFGLLAHAFHPLDLVDWPRAVFSLVASFLASLLAFFAPAGLGVREAVMTITLETLLPVRLTAIVAVASRLALTVSELLAFAASWLWLALRSSARARHNRSITQKD